jgi:hypothetical protein
LIGTDPARVFRSVVVLDGDGSLSIGHGQTDEIIAIDDVLKALETLDQRKARVVELRFFGGAIGRIPVR